MSYEPDKVTILDSKAVGTRNFIAIRDYLDINEDEKYPQRDAKFLQDSN